MTEHDLTFPCMGSEVRLLAAGPGGAKAAADVRAWIEDYARRLSRFEPDSELCRLNADPAHLVRATPLLRLAVRAAQWAAQHSGGLVDPTLLGALERAGYAASLKGAEPAPLALALASAPVRRPAEPSPAARWRRFVVDDACGTIARPPGLRLDNGGSGKGLAADLAARRLAGHDRWAVDCGGDLLVHGGGRPYEVEIRHPLTGQCAHTAAVDEGAVCTSGVDVRVWRRPDGTYAHHLLDPSTEEPAWTGLVGATALAPSALEAETLAKAALLSGPERGRELLVRNGGILFAEDGGVELVGRLRDPVRRRIDVADLRRFLRDAA
jgi:thiamine biosynthesis lipoprotein